MGLLHDKCLSCIDPKPSSKNDSTFLGQDKGKPKAKDKGFNFVHLGLIQVGINLYFCRGLPVHIVAFLLDTRHGWHRIKLG